MLKPNVLNPGEVFIPPLENGDQLSRDEFERRYEAMPAGKNAELIEGVVSMASPARWDFHARPHARLGHWLTEYELRTPGVQVGTGATLRLDLENEPQPDLAMLIDPQRSGRAVISEDNYVVGGTELVAEVSASTVSVDRNAKLRVYRRNGIQEYLIWRVLDEELDWFVLRGTDYERLEPDADGILRSATFPGLWLDAESMIRLDQDAVVATLQRGIRSDEHAEFSRRLS